jgi:hypothetical protein
MFGGLKLNQVKQIVGISRKLQFDKAKLDKLIEAREQGADEEQVLAELLGVPEGQDAKEYLHSRLTDQEYEVLREVVNTYTKGKGKNPLE